MSANKLLTSINTKAGIQQDRTPETSRLSVSSESYYCYINAYYTRLPNCTSSIYAVDINMILDTVFKIYVDF